ncbi:Chemosensory protein [Gryllus bimaculatus]|nr:Chemosensory protein [Gryllus bimaculatus]
MHAFLSISFTMRPHDKIMLAVGVFFASFLACVAQDELVVLFVNQDGNGAAEEAYESVLRYVRAKGIKIYDQYRAHGNGTNAEAFLDLLCSAYNQSLVDNRKPHLVLDMTRYDVPSETTKSFTKLLGLPTVSGSFGQAGDLRQWRNLDAKREAYLIQVNPPYDMIAEVVRPIVNNQNISNAGVLFDNKVVMDHKYKSLLQNIPTRHLINEVQSGRIRYQLENFKRLELFNYFIIGDLKTIKTALDAGDGLESFDRKFAWHTISLDAGTPTTNCSKCSFLHIKPVQGTSTRERLQMLQTDYGLKAETPIEASFYFDIMLQGILAANALKSKYEGWDYTACNDYEEHMNIVRDLNLRTEFIKAGQAEGSSYAAFTVGGNGREYQDFSTSIQKIDVLNGAMKGNAVEVGTWRAGYDTKLVPKNETILRNMSAVTVYTIVTLEKFKGYCIDLIEEIKNITTFEYDIYHVPDGEAGNMDENGKWNGMIKELIEKRADIALGALSVMAERENVIDFTVPYYDLVGITILMKKPKTPTSLFKFLTVLENEVWLCILAAYFFTSFLMWIFDRWSPYSYQNNREKYKDDEEKREFNLKECLWFCMTSLTPQGGGEAPKNLSGRLVAATWWLFGFIIIASYTANLAAFLTVSRLDTPVESLDDLSKQYKIQYAPIMGSSAYTYFQRMADIENRFYEIWKDMSLNDSLTDVERSKLAVWDYPVSDKYTKILQAMTEAKFPKNMTEALERVRESKTSSEGFAFIGDATDIKYLQLTNCDLQVVGEEFSRKPYALAVQQGSPLKDQFNNAILQLLNKRKLEKLKERWWNQNPEKAQDCEKQDDQSDGISIQNIGGVFIVIFVGIGLALITLAFEYFWYKVKKNPRVIDVGPAGQAPTVPSKMDAGLTMRGFRPRLPFGGEQNFNRGGVPLAGVTNPW